MDLLSHTSAKPSHYNLGAESYDAFNEEASLEINRTIEALLKKYKVKTVLDLTCGTGSQVLFLAKQGYDVVGSDINAKMVKIAQEKAAKEKLKVRLIKGDMRTVKLGTFDAALTIFNAVGHLTKGDFEKAIRKIRENLKPGGLYIFDIFNLNYLRNGDRITELTIDWQKTAGDTKVRDIQYSTLDEDGILASYTISFAQKGSNKPKITQSSQTLQIYTAKQLKEMLDRNGFKVLSQSEIDGSKFDENKSDRILMVAKSIHFSKELP